MSGMTEDEQIAMAIAMSLQDAPQGVSTTPPERLNRGRALGDMFTYRQGYPEYGHSSDSLDLITNILFYRNQSGLVVKNRRGGTERHIFIEDFHNEKWGDYEFLEEVHNYIQGLFPIQERVTIEGIHQLQRHEVEIMRKDPLIRQRVLKSYELMLDFFGFQFAEGGNSSGKIERSSHYLERYSNWNTSFNHNFLRITRILKCLGEVGLEQPYKKEFLLFVSSEVLSGALEFADDALRSYWIHSLKVAEEREELCTLLGEPYHADPPSTSSPSAPAATATTLLPS
eukprot:TRINITY_DN5266_c0_g1_i1.p1 TRINITY_DN5266_c0_g1~~TRINITY_DN5266_c0_g1_i1.p1  ORF type:complete len:292 (+),score=52.23 TRINITY_DN5266_c0_g1_i1:25-876(+)